MPVSEEEVRHFLGRVGFAPSDADIGIFIGREIPDIVNDVLTFPANLPNNPGHFDDDNWLSNQRTVDWWLTRMRDSRWADRDQNIPHPLVEKMTLFWHGHFASGFDKVGDAELMWQQNQILREHALGDFESMCQQISLHGAMLIYLDNETNVVDGVQENFARELMELFTMGIGNYTEEDVVSMARAWTGHGTVGWIHEEQRYDGTYEWHPDQHDYGDKTIFGITQNWDGPQTITEICRGVRQQPTARFVATKLWRFFVNGAPSPAAVDALANSFVAGGMSIRELMRALLTHPDFWAPASRQALVKSPTQFVVDFARRTGVTFNDTTMRWFMRPMGQTLLEPPNVSGWGTNGYWLSTATTWGRAQYVNTMRHELNQAGFLSQLETLDVDPATTLILTTFGIPNASTATVSAIKAWFSATKADNPWALPRAAVTIAGLSPEFQVN